jgi:hypothetical protein
MHAQKDPLMTQPYSTARKGATNDVREPNVMSNPRGGVLSASTASILQ